MDLKYHLKHETSQKVLETGPYLLGVTHSSSLSNHLPEVQPMERINSTRVRRCRAPCYPVMVPDISTEHVDEAELRRVASTVLFGNDANVFKRRIFPESTSDVFKQKHEVRHYLDTMHPYVDPQDKYRKFTKSRLVNGNHELDSNTKHGDFLNPRSSSSGQQRTTGYNRGHIRSVLQLDTFGPEHSREIELKRDIGLLPDSPNPDRNRDLRLEVCAEMNKKTMSLLHHRLHDNGSGGSSSARSESDGNKGQRREKKPHKNNCNNNQHNNKSSHDRDGDDSSSMGLLSVMSPPQGQGGTKEQRRQPMQSQSEKIRPSTGATTNNNNRSNGSGSGINDNPLNLSLKTTRASTAGTKTRYRPGTVPTADNCPNHQDRLMTDSVARSLEWYHGYIKSVQNKALHVLEMKERRRYTQEQQREAMIVSDHLDWFENRLNTLHNSKVDKI